MVMKSSSERRRSNTRSEQPVRSLADRESSAFRRICTKLARVGPGSTIDDVFAAMAGEMPFAAGFLETFPESKPWEAFHSPFRLPAGLPEVIMDRKPYEPQEVLDVVANLPVGSFAVDRDTLPQETWERVEGYQALRRSGLGGGAAALKLRKTRGASGPEHTYLALLLQDGAALPNPATRALVCAVAPAVRAAVDRLAVPLLQRFPFTVQMIEEQTLGCVVVNESGVVHQANRMAYALAREYGPSLHVNTHRCFFSDFVDAVLRMPRSLRDGRRHFVRPSPRVQRHLEVSSHELDPDAYDLPERLGVILLREISPLVDPGARMEEALGELDDIEQKIVRAMVTSKATNKQLAVEMGLGLRALEKRVQRIADKLSIHVPRGTRVRPLLRQLLTSK
ncbi:hypothetical protein [Sorangium sp. So ce1151]|uniref:hypothetical protein n=1 Tax=Sorangium sp. So ce1151 TaxID=3133332 RepID=UPI003F626D57